MKKKFAEIWSKADDVVLRYPMVLTMALIAAASAFVFFEVGHLNYRQEQQIFPVTKLIFTGCLGISLMFAVKMLSQRFGRNLLFEVIGVAILTLFYFVLPEKEKDFTQMYAFIVVPVFILSHLLVSIGAFIGQQSELNFWQFNKNLFINTFLTGVFTGVLTGGIMLAILAVDKLFDFKIDDYRYTQTAFFLLIFGSCFIFLLFNEKGLFSLEKDGSYPQILKFFTQFVLIPLLLVYVVILYFYSAKILLNWELPKGWVSYLILAYSVVGILAQLLIYPLKNDAAKSWVKVFSKAFYYTLLPLLILLFVAINTRILQYGYTEPRYYVLLLALWLTSVVLYFIFIRKASIKFIPVSLFVFGLFALLMPYFNAVAVAKRSQKNELNKILSENNLLQNGKITFSSKVSDATADEIASKFQFLSDRNEDDYLKSFLDDKKQNEMLPYFADNKSWELRTGNLKYFGKNPLAINTEKVEFSELVNKERFVRTNGYQYVVKINELAGEGVVINGDRFSFDSPNEHSQKIYLNKKESVDFYPYFKSVFQNVPESSGKKEVGTLEYTSELGKYRIKIVFSNLNRPDNLPEAIYYNDATVLIGLK